MAMVESFDLNTPDAWQYVQSARTRVREALADHPQERRDAAVMVASELVENAIKYGEGVPKASCATLKLEVTDSAICLEVSNGVRAIAAVREIESHINQIACAMDPGDLYVVRVLELLTNPDSKGKLGLCRIRHEGRFELHFRYEDEVLTVTATRRIA
jgi:hypothetical protein